MSGLPPVRVVIPWRPAPSRMDAFERVVSWYREALPGVPVDTVDTGDTPFVLAACRNRAMSEAQPDEVVVIGDADTLPEIEPPLEPSCTDQVTALLVAPLTSAVKVTLVPTIVWVASGEIEISTN